MEKRGGVHGELRACNVFIDEDGQAKFTDLNIFGKISNSYTKTMLKIAKCPVSPELLSNLKGAYPHNYSLN